MTGGAFMLLLHAHLPYVRHPEDECFLEERWFYEACVETYLPLLHTLTSLAEEGIRFRITVSLSPTLLAMMSDPLLNRRLKRHIESLIGLTERELKRTGGDASLEPLARFYHDRILKIQGLYEDTFGEDLVSGFRALAETGCVEFITTAATHAYLANLAPHPKAVLAQIRTGLRAFEAHMGRQPEGFWLPECGYYAGLDEILHEAGVGYFFLESHGILHARPRPEYGVFRPVRSHGGPAAFAREAQSARTVWCALTGYPGDPFYRDFYRDIGYDLPLSEIAGHIHPDGIRHPTGIKYHRITGPGDTKEPYVRELAVRKAEEHASDFLMKLDSFCAGLSSSHNFEPLIVAPYDAELFGHWWYEGVEWLEFLLRGLDGAERIRPVTPTGYLAGNTEFQTVTLSPSSWGEGGHGRTWADGTNAWALPQIHRACAQMEEMVKRHDGSPRTERVLRQAMRELLLAQDSDWPFLMHRDTSAAYAERRLVGHLENFFRLSGMSGEGRMDDSFLASLEDANAIFPDADCFLY
jgi:1,4-alpha-glucan branching enzyme